MFGKLLGATAAVAVALNRNLFAHANPVVSRNETTSTDNSTWFSAGFSDSHNYDPRNYEPSTQEMAKFEKELAAMPELYAWGDWPQIANTTFNGTISYGVYSGYCDPLEHEDPNWCENPNAFSQKVLATAQIYDNGTISFMGPSVNLAFIPNVPTQFIPPDEIQSALLMLTDCGLIPIAKWMLDILKNGAYTALDTEALSIFKNFTVSLLEGDVDANFDALVQDDLSAFLQNACAGASFSASPSLTPTPSESNSASSSISASSSQTVTATATSSVSPSQSDSLSQSSSISPTASPSPSAHTTDVVHHCPQSSFACWSAEKKALVLSAAGVVGIALLGLWCCHRKRTSAVGVERQPLIKNLLHTIRYTESNGGEKLRKFRPKKNIQQLVQKLKTNKNAFDKLDFIPNVDDDGNITFTINPLFVKQNRQQATDYSNLESYARMLEELLSEQQGYGATSSVSSQAVSVRPSGEESPFLVIARTVLSDSFIPAPPPNANDDVPTVTVTPPTPRDTNSLPLNE
ncbi:MAG: hypothetical protein V4591_12180 [Bdellovibrionota bacterium]